MKDKIIKKIKKTYKSLLRLVVNTSIPVTMHVAPVINGKHRLLGPRVILSNSLNVFC